MEAYKTFFIALYATIVLLGLRNQKLVLKNIEIQVNSERIRLEFYNNENTNLLLNGELGQGLNLSTWNVPCTPPDGTESICRQWEDKVRMTVERQEINQAICYTVSWEAFDASSAHWYGGAETYNQPWPLSKHPIKMQSFITGDFVARPKELGSLLEPYWLNSNGVAIYVADDFPLHYSSDQNKICFKSSWDDPFYRNLKRENLRLEYKLCYAGDLKETHMFMINQFFERPKGIPDETMFRYPIWSTWAKYKVFINQTTLLKFAKEINQYGFPNSQIELDDMYTERYGDFLFDQKKFPDAKGMLATLHKMGFRVTSWIMPFANTDSHAFYVGAKEHYFIQNSDGNTPALVKWWQGIGAIIDPTNQMAANWWVKRLEEMQSLGIDSFKFDAGEVVYLPSDGKLNKTLKNPGYFTKHYIDMVSKFSSQIEVRAGYKTQQHPIFVRMLDKDSRWGYDNGLKTLIPTALFFGFIGYPFILPDMVGGNGYGNINEADSFVTETFLPEKELFIRWLQISTFLPSLQFSFVPWQYDNETIEIAKKMITLHADYVTPICLKLAKQATQTGEPIIRPLWWIAPNDAITMTIDSEFLLGNDVLVAPVVEKGATKHLIYFPDGLWKDKLRGTSIQGPKWLDYNVALHEVPYFERVPSDN